MLDVGARTSCEAERRLDHIMSSLRASSSFESTRCGTNRFVPAVVTVVAEQHLTMKLAHEGLIASRRHSIGLSIPLSHRQRPTTNGPVEGLKPLPFVARHFDETPPTPGVSR